MKIWNITEWLSHTRQWLEQHYDRFWIRGEVSNFMQASSGHQYFVLKEGAAQIRCVLFRSYTQKNGLKLCNGQQIEALAQATIYEERGDLQLRIEMVRDAGLGDLWQRFLALKAKLEAQGWFSADHKRPLPTHPRRLGIITSLKAAALRDVIITLRHRAPSLSIILYPTPVQGDEAPYKIAETLRKACTRAEVDLLILCRGGGGLDDLAAFNDEIVAKAIYEATLPVISGVGHETDFTIADFVADVRAPTPTAAAVMAAPDERELKQRLLQYAHRIFRLMHHRIEHEQMRLDHLNQQLKNPYQRVIAHRQHLHYLLQRWQRIRIQEHRRYQHLISSHCQRLRLIKVLPSNDRLKQLWDRLQQARYFALQSKFMIVERLRARYQTAHPLAPLERGYALVTTGFPEESVVTSIKGLAAKQALRVSLQDGSVDVTITSITPSHYREQIQE